MLTTTKTTSKSKTALPSKTKSFLKVGEAAKFCLFEATIVELLTERIMFLEQYGVNEDKL